MRRIALLLAFTTFFTLCLLIPKSTLALENPSLYYDWNTYIDPNNEVLGLEIKAQEEGVTPSGSDSATPNPSPAPQTVSTDYKNYEGHNYFFRFTSDWTPSDPFYFVKKVEEGVTIAFTFNEEKQQELRLEYAGERLHEMEQAIVEGKTQVVDNLAKAYEADVQAIANTLTKMKEEGKDVTELANLVDLECAKHNLVLEEVAIQSPGEVAIAVDEAIIATENLADAVADVEDRPAVPEAVVERLQAQKAFGILTEEEVQKVIDSETRTEARQELREFVNADLFPESDFKKFDETAAQNYPRGYYTVLELKKFEELQRLETERPDGGTIAKVQEFAKTYKYGDTVPTEIRRWWVPMVRLEELQNTIRPDLINGDYFRNRPEYNQKYQEVVERVKPRQEDIDYVNNLIKNNPNILNDPAYARIKAIADKFGVGTGERSQTFNTSEGTASRVSECGRGSHWVFINYMPGGGYCVPNYDFPRDNEGGSGTPCPSGYHRNYLGGACYPDSVDDGSVILPAPGSCYAGYHWVSGYGGRGGGYCTPDTVTDGGGFPSPIYTIGYCLPGQMFQDGKCETYNPPPKEGCGSGSWWNGSQCIQVKSCAAGQYQDRNGDCKDNSEARICIAPASGCGFNSVWDSKNCSCRSTFQPWDGSGSSGSGSPSADQQEAACKSGGGRCVSWVNGACGCEYSSTNTGSGGGSGSCQPTSAGCPGGYWDYASCGCKPSDFSNQIPYSGSSGSTSCGSGYFWAGSYCAPSGDNNYPTPNYGSGGSYSYPTPSYGTPANPIPYYGSDPSYSYPTPYSGGSGSGYSYPSPSYPTPSYQTPEYPTPAYTTPSYGTPE